MATYNVQMYDKESNVIYYEHVMDVLDYAAARDKMEEKYPNRTVIAVSKVK